MNLTFLLRRCLENEINEIFHEYVVNPIQVSILIDNKCNFTIIVDGIHSEFS